LQAQFISEYVITYSTKETNRKTVLKVLGKRAVMAAFKYNMKVD